MLRLVAPLPCHASFVFFFPRVWLQNKERNECVSGINLLLPFFVADFINLSLSLSREFVFYTRDTFSLLEFNIYVYIHTKYYMYLRMYILYPRTRKVSTFSWGVET